MPAKVQPRHTLSYQLREVVESRGLTPYALGRLAEVDPGVISRWMNGRRDIRLETADRLALALGVRLAELSRPAAARKSARAARPARPIAVAEVGQPAECRPPSGPEPAQDWAWADSEAESPGHCQLAEPPATPVSAWPDDPGPPELCQLADDAGVGPADSAPPSVLWWGQSSRAIGELDPS